MDDIVNKVVGELQALYSDSPVDQPDKVLNSYPNPQKVVKAHKTIIDIILPGRISFEQAKKETLAAFLSQRIEEARVLLLPEISQALIFAKSAQNEVVSLSDISAEQVFERFLRQLPEIRRQVILDIEACYKGDPAAFSYAEVKLTYPGLFAIVSHRVAHEFYKLGVAIIPRIMNEWTHSKTGIDIHPGASIGPGFFIDHGTGVVIGETSSIGSNVKIYQGVTLGAKSFPLDQQGRAIKNIKRHPNVEDDVVIYANATILGGDTTIGRGSVIGGGVFLMESVKAGSFVANAKPELFIKKQ